MFLMSVSLDFMGFRCLKRLVSSERGSGECLESRTCLLQLILASRQGQPVSVLQLAGSASLGEPVEEEEADWLRSFEIQPPVVRSGHLRLRRSLKIDPFGPCVARMASLCELLRQRSFRGAATCRGPLP